MIPAPNDDEQTKQQAELALKKSLQWLPRGMRGTTFGLMCLARRHKLLREFREFESNRRSNPDGR